MVKDTGLSALVATHNFELADKMDRRVRLQEGRLIDLRAGIAAETVGGRPVVSENFY